MNATTEEMTDTTEDATDTEVVRYEKAYRETRRVLDECIESLMILEALAEDLAERDQIVSDRADLQSSRADLVRANVAFHARQVTMVPPSAGLVAEIVALSKTAVELTVERTTVSAILRLATSALKKFAEIQKIGSGSP